jgi:hypothetical protein
MYTYSVSSYKNSLVKVRMLISLLFWDIQCVWKAAVHLQKVLEVMSTSVYTGLNPLNFIRKHFLQICIWNVAVHLCWKWCPRVSIQAWTELSSQILYDFFSYSENFWNVTPSFLVVHSTKAMACVPCNRQCCIFAMLLWLPWVKIQLPAHSTRGFKNPLFSDMGQDNTVGIVTFYRLDGLGIKSRWGRDFPHLFRLALGPT